MFYGQIPPKSSLKSKFVIFKPEKVTTQQRFEILVALDTFSGLKRTNLNYVCATFRWNLTIVHKNKIESNKKLIFKKKFCFPKFPLFNPLASFDLNLFEKGPTKYFKNGLKSFHISHLPICTVYLF